METRIEETREKSPRGAFVNSLKPEEINRIVEFLKTEKFKRNTPYVQHTERGWKCNLKPTKDSKGNPKHPQLDLKRFGHPGKQLVHMIWWRYENFHSLVRDDFTISHCDADQEILHLVEESRDCNESRKYCHLFGWYKTKVGEDRPRCPHWEHPCTGP